jgi:pentatricopeptide repeat protein
LASRTRLPDAVAFEALINVLVTLRRTDLVPTYLERLQRSGVHMTAYIANLLIRGYAAAGDIEQARVVFESLANPPVGVAAPNNHAPHDTSVPRRISPNEFVYREVSF